MKASTSIATIVVLVLAAASAAHAHGPLNAGFPVAGAAPAGAPAGTPGPGPGGQTGPAGGTTPTPGFSPSSGGSAGGTTPGGSGPAGGAGVPGGATPSGATGALPSGKKGTSKPSTAGDRARRGGTTRSAQAIERVNVDWFPATLPTVKEGKYAARTLPVEFLADARFRFSRHRAGIPIMVAMTTEGGDLERFAESEAKWTDMQVGVSSLLFNCYRINLDDMDADFVQRYGGGKAPLVLFLDEQGQELAKLSGWNVDSKRLISTMSRIVKQRWSRDLNRVVAKEIEILKDFDAAAWTQQMEKKALESDEKAFAAKPTPRLKKSIAARKKAIAAARKAAAKATQAEAKLLAFLGVTPIMPAPQARSQAEVTAN